ncbi:MAG: DUF932 domain-containing protein [Patescibacteria group bacterium]
MKEGRSLVDLAKELERQLDTKKDYVAPTNLMEVIPVPKTLQDDGEMPLALDLYPTLNAKSHQVDEEREHFGLTSLAENQIREFADVPAKYYKRLKDASPMMAANELNFWLGRQNTPRLIRTLDGNVRAFLSDRYRTIDNYDLAEAALPILLADGQVQVVSAEVTDNHLYIKVVTQRLTFEVKPGDVVQAGLCLSNSEVGLGAVTVEPLLYRLVCLNGAVINDRAMRKFHLGRRAEGMDSLYELFRDETRKATDKAFMMQVQDVIRSAFDEAEFTKLRGTVVDASTRRIEAPVETVLDRVIERFNFREHERGGLLQRLVEGGDLSQWGLANAVTNLANSAEDYERATELERAGGEIITLPATQWRELAIVPAA